MAVVFWPWHDEKIVCREWFLRFSTGRLVAKITSTAWRVGAHGTLVQFLMLTALRRNEAAELRRSEVVAGSWPPTRTTACPMPANVFGLLD
jgi:hypothetical protein